MPSIFMFLVKGRDVEILGIYGGTDRVYGATQDATGEIHREEQALAGSGTEGMIHRIVGERRCDRAGFDSVQSVRPVDALEVQILEILRRGGAQHVDVGNIVSV